MTVQRHQSAQIRVLCDSSRYINLVVVGGGGGGGEVTCFKNETMSPVSEEICSISNCLTDVDSRHRYAELHGLLKYRVTVSSR